MTRSKNLRSPAPAVRPRASRAGGRGGTLLGVFIGLVIGLSLAAGVAYYVTKANSPYAAQSVRDARDAPRDGGKGGKAEAPAADKPRFDFYKILPGGEEPKVQVERKPPPDRAVVDQAREKDAERAAPKVATVDPSPKVDPSAKAAKAGERFWLQAGSFAAESDAENLKAQLALAGWEAAVQQGALPDKGVRFRVRLGPYDNTDELNRIKTELARKGFDAAVIKF